MALKVAAIGIEDRELLVLKSLLGLVAKAAHAEIGFVDDTATAGIVFVARQAVPRIAELQRSLGSQATLIHCGPPPAAALPDGVRVLAHCPPRVNELAPLIAELRHAAAATPQLLAPAATTFAVEQSLAGAIHTRIPRLLADHPLLVEAPGWPPLLVDSPSCIRVVHADPVWFAEAEAWRTPPESCRFAVATDRPTLAALRRNRVLPYLALRFWGVMSASSGRPVEEVAGSREAGLRRLPNFPQWPHRDWQPPLAEAMLTRTDTPGNWARHSRRPLAEVVDFLNAAAVVGLLATR